MHLTKPTLLLLALTISAGCVLALTDPEKSGTALAGDFLGSLKDLSQFGQALHEAAAQTLSDFSSSVQAGIRSRRGPIWRVTNGVERNALKMALMALEGINSSIVDLESTVADINEQLEEKRQKHARAIKEQLTNWAADELKRVKEETSGAGSADAEATIDKLQNRYAAYLHSCVEELQVRQVQYEQNVQETIPPYQTGTDNLIKRMDICLKRTFTPAVCRRGIDRACVPLRNAPREIQKHTLQGLELLIVGLDASGCVDQTLAALAREKPNMERQLNEIIEEEPSSAETSPPGGNSSSDATASPSPGEESSPPATASPRGNSSSMRPGNGSWREIFLRSVLGH